jgi:hypothetical protein
MRCLKTLTSVALAASLLAVTACGDDGGGSSDGENPEEVITTVGLKIRPMGGSNEQRFEVNDPDGDGGDPPTIQPITLTPGAYTVLPYFENRLETPAEDITIEISDESDEHQILFTGTAVNGPASDEPAAPLAHTYDDEDVNGLPIGLENTFVATAGTGQLTVTLRHLPPINDVASKDASVADDVKAGGISAAPGATDASVTYPVTVE